MQQHLVYFVIIELRRKISRDRNALRRKIAQPCPSPRMIKAKTPGAIAKARCEVHTYERISPHPHTRKLSHG
jgi:hypothetical protein